MTVKEIAQRAGVSIGTVDRVLHNRGRVSDETRETIMRIIREHDYRPNPLARHLQRGKGYVFRVFMPRQDNESYWDLALQGVEQAALELKAFGVAVEVVEFNRYRPESARKAFRKILEAGCDGLALAPVDPENMAPLVAQLPASLPYVFFDATLEPSNPVCRIGQEPFRSGYLAGRLMGLLKPGARNLAIINSHPQDLHLNRRVQGFRSYFDQRPGTVPEILEYKAANRASGADMAALCQELRASAPLPDGLYICNASAAEFLQELGNLPGLQAMASRPGIVGHDLVPANCRLLADGLIDCLISQRPEQQTAQALRLLYRRVVLQEACPPQVAAPLEVVFRENLEEPLL